MVDKLRLLMGLGSITNIGIKRKFPQEFTKVDVEYMKNIEDTSLDFNLGMSFAYFQLYDIFKNLMEKGGDIKDIADAIRDEVYTLDEAVEEIQNILECESFVAVMIATQFVL